MTTEQTLHTAFYGPMQEALSEAMTALRRAQELAEAVLREADEDSWSHHHATAWLRAHGQEQEAGA